MAYINLLALCSLGGTKENHEKLQSEWSVWICGLLYNAVGNYRSRDSSVDIATSYGLDGLDSIPGRGKRFFFIPQRLARFWSPPSLLFSGYRLRFPRR
jgi:hypothetical protein